MMYNRYIAPVVKWISYPPSKRSLQVRLLPGAQNTVYFVQDGARRRESGSCKFLAKNYA